MMIRSVGAELLVLRKRASTWILMGIWVALAMMFSYLLPYLTYRGSAEAPTQASLGGLLPQSLDDTLLGGFPFFGGVFSLMLGVLAIGSEYGWDTLKTLFTQRAGRMQMFAAKLLALALALIPFVVVVFVAGALASYSIAQAEGAAIAWPSASSLLGALAAGWFILGAWAAFGVLLAVLSRGTALATGVGILYTFFIEGLIGALASEISWFEPLVDYFLRANAYSLVTALGVSAETFADNGPGAFFGPFVDGGQATLVLTAYTVGFLLLSVALLRRRDVG